MKKHFYIYTVVVFFFGWITAFSQINSQEFTIDVTVVDEATNQNIKGAEVEIDGRIYSYPNINGVYKVKAKIGDRLVVSHPDFETVYYTIKIKDDIKISVKDFVASKYSKKKMLRRKSRGVSKNVMKSSNLFQQNLDSATFYQKKNIDKSISFVENILKESPTKKQTATSYVLLGDVYRYWKQYDLAIENYKSSLRESSKTNTRIKLAKTQYLHGKYQDSEANYKRLLKEKLTNYQKINVYQGLADVYFRKKNFLKAEKNYQKAFRIAKANKVTPKITDLQSKLAEVYAEDGKKEKAEVYFQNSLELASKENKKRSLKQQEKVADYYNKSSRYDDEIKLRQQTLEEAEDAVSVDEKGIINDTINSQKINYKIANAYILKEDYKEAIPYLKKSIREANKKEDLTVEKDATRKVAEVYEAVGDGEKALEAYREYIKLVDKAYIRKEQEIVQASRFSKKISDNQNRIKSLEKDKELTESKISLAYKDQQLIQESNKRQQLYIYALILGFALMSLLAYFMYRNIKQQKIANNLLALKSMRSQMNPHFIFNALNSVNSFIAVNDERNANRYLSEFSVLMRSVLENSDEDFIPFSKEIDLLELYVKLEHNRFKDKFDYTISVNDSIDLEAYKIPPMLLQPYIENAIWHGLRYKEEKGSLEITIDKKSENSIEIIIKDNGIGRQKSAELKTKNQLKQKSKGMSTVKNRVKILNDMYKDKIDVSIADVEADGSGTKVSVTIKK